MDFCRWNSWKPENNIQFLDLTQYKKCIKNALSQVIGRNRTSTESGYGALISIYKNLQPYINVSNLNIMTKYIISRRGARTKVLKYYNPGKNVVDFLNFQTLSPSPLIQCWYLGDMCCKSTLPEQTLFGGWGGDLR
jgi:hypothetical protein